MTQMTSSYKHAAAHEAIKQLIAELSSATAQLKSRKIIFFVLSGKLFWLISATSNPPRSVLVRSYNQFTLGYTMEIPSGDAALDQQVEVFRDKSGELYLEENGVLLTPRELALKLVDLIAAQ